MKLKNDQNIGTKKKNAKKVFLPKMKYMHACAKKKQLHIRGSWWMHACKFLLSNLQGTLYTDREYFILCIHLLKPPKFQTLSNQHKLLYM